MPGAISSTPMGACAPSCPSVPTRWTRCSAKPTPCTTSVRVRATRDVREDVMDRVVPYEIALAPTAASVAVARRYFAAIAGDAGLPGRVRDTGALVVSELVTNAVQH